MRLSYLTVDLIRGSLYNVISMRSTIMLVAVGNAFCFLSSLLRLVLVLACLFVTSLSNLVSCSLTGFFSCYYNK